MKTLILGPGNPIRGDDAVGWVVTSEVYERVKGGPGLFLNLASVRGIYILDILEGYKQALIIDSAETGKNKTGTLFRVEINTCEAIKPSFCTMHQIDILQALNLGIKLELDLPERVNFYGIEVENCQNYSEQISLDVKMAIPQIIDQICSEEFEKGKLITHNS